WATATRMTNWRCSIPFPLALRVRVAYATFYGTLGHSRRDAMDVGLKLLPVTLREGRVISHAILPLERTGLPSPLRGYRRRFASHTRRFRPRLLPRRGVRRSGRREPGRRPGRHLELDRRC